MNSPQLRTDAGRTRLLVLLLIVIGIGLALGIKTLVNWRSELHQQSFFNAATEAREAKNWALLRSTAERWVEWDPESNTGWLALADACQNLDDLDCAQSALGEVGSDDPRYLEARALRGDILYLDLQRPFDAEENWKSMLAINPASSDAFQGLISFYAFSVQRDKMMETIREAISRGSEPRESYVYLLLGDRLSFKTALFRVDEWLRKNPQSEILRVARAYYLARHQSAENSTIQETNTFYQGDWSEMKTLLESFPQNLNVLAFHIENALIQGDLRQAAEMLNQLPAGAERDYRFWRFRAQAFLEQEEGEKSTESAFHSLKLNPYDWRSRLILAEAYRMMMQPEKAKHQANLGVTGKNLERKLLNLQNPVDVWDEAIEDVYQYVVDVGDELAARAIERRLSERTPDQ